MNDLQISKALALAIGWTEDDTNVTDHCVVCWHDLEWKKFDYRDPVIVMAVAERYECFAYKVQTGKDKGKWVASCPHADMVHAGTPAKAIAMAVIKMMEMT